MSNKIEALWDCPFCGTKGIGGLTKSCPGCGKPQHENTVFYLPEEKNYLDEETAAKYGQGADWLCGSCGTMNRCISAFCTNCGSAKENSKDDYFSNEEKLKEKAKAKAAAVQPKKPKKKRIWPLILLAMLAVILVVSLLPKNADTTLTAKSWLRNIQIEEFTTMTESDWSVPEGGREISSTRSIHHYEQVVDHYEYENVQRSRQVPDGYDVSTSYQNNGDGTFSSYEVETPRYRTEYYTERVKTPVYRDEPIYKTKYTYDIDRWVPVENVTTKGAADEPYWGEYTPTNKQREGTRSETYTMTFTDKNNNAYTATVTEDQWHQLNIGDSAKLTFQAGDLISINDVPVAP